MTVVGTYFVIYVNDMDRATAFYKDALGAHVGFSSPEWTSLSIAGTSVGLHAGADTNERIIGFGVDVDDLDAACSAVTACGGRLIDAPQELPEEGITIAKVADTEGNVFSMTLPGDH
jgi:predicted enzyme related to lactoylglutathione lyase